MSLPALTDYEVYSNISIPAEVDYPDGEYAIVANGLTGEIQISQFNTIVISVENRKVTVTSIDIHDGNDDPTPVPPTPPPPPTPVEPQRRKLFLPFLRS